MSDNLIPVALIPPESLSGTHGVVWLAQDGRRTTTQVAQEVRYTLQLVPNRANALGETAIVAPSWVAHLEVSRRESYLRAGTEIVLALDDGRKALGMLTNVRGGRTIRADVRLSGWLEDWQ